MSLAAIAPDVGVVGERVFPTLAGVYPRTKYTGLPTKDETILRNYQLIPSVFLHSGFLAGQNWHISVLAHLVNQQNTQLNAETKSQTTNRIIFSLLGRLYCLILCG